MRASREAAKPALLRAMNLRTTFELVHAHGPMAAPQIVRATGLSKPTISEVLGQLVQLGLLRRGGRTSGAPGPSAQLYDVNPRAGWVLSIDVGRLWVRAALSDLTGAIVSRSSSRTPKTAKAVIAQMSAAVQDLTAEAGIERADLDQVVVGTPGVILPGDDHLSLAPQLPGWERPQVVRTIRDALGAPVIFENDVKLAAVGEHVDGVAQGSDDFVLISLGTGIGMAAIVDGALRRGASGLAGEIGYLPLDVDGDRRHTQGTAWGTGDFESLVTSAAIEHLAERNGLPRGDGAAGVFTAARRGDPRALRVVDTEARRLAYAVAAVAAVLDPELVVLGGGVGAGGGDLLLPLIARSLTAISPFSPRLAVSTLGADAVIAGARASGMRVALDRIFGGDLVLAASSNGSSPLRPGRPAASNDAGAGHHRVASAG
jgi:predicted NBD/HSP70 family sugar kinase